MGERLHIVKVGGAIVEDPRSLASLLSRFSQLEGKKILIHGGGRLATTMATRLGIESRMVEGRRITDADTLEVVTMVYGGLVNKRIVARLQAMDTNAIGLTGADAGIILSHKREVKEVDYGFVGDVDHVDGTLLSTFLDHGLTPVIAPLTHDGQGQMLNTNADTMARVVAEALAQRYEVSLIFCFEKAGVLTNPDDDTSSIPFINTALFQDLKARGIVSGGMIPKIENALQAVDHGVAKVLITRADLLGQDGGTLVAQHSQDAETTR